MTIPPFRMETGGYCEFDPDKEFSYMNLFDTLPGGFFNCLASGSSNRIYADCPLLIYHEYDREITYRIPRSQVRDALAVYLMEHQIEHLEEEPEENTNYNELANGVIRRFCSREVGWLEEDIDDATYEKHIICLLYTSIRSMKTFFFLKIRFSGTWIRSNSCGSTRRRKGSVT